MQLKRYAGVIVRCNNKVLLCKRNNQGSFPGMWSIPGGKVEPNEEIQDGARREFYEETDVKIDDKTLNFVGVIPRHTRDGKKVKGMMYVYCLDTDQEIYPDLENAVDGEEHTECGYFEKDEVKPEYAGESITLLVQNLLK